MPATINNLSAFDLIRLVADAHHDLIGNLAPELAGHNGPYRHQQTLVRNLSHWLVTCAALSDWTGKKKYRDAARVCADYLTSDGARPSHGAFFHRDHESRDRCNGLIGPAWTFEGLIAASRLFGDDSFLNLGREVYNLYPFDETEGLWKIVEVDGSIRGFDGTFNHQLWFAVTGYLLGNALADDEIMQKTRVFFDRIEQNLTVLDSGLILHLSHRQFEAGYRRMTSLRGRFQRFKNGLRRARFCVLTPSWEEYRMKKESELINKSVGYHAFNTHAFSLVKGLLEHGFWQTPGFSRLRDYLDNVEYRNAVQEESTYGFPYNAPGFEVPVSLYHLDAIPEDEFIDQAQWWLQAQIDRTYDAKNATFSRNTADPATLTARVYELTRLPKQILERINIQLPS